MIIQANALSIPIKTSSVHCIITSPPYRGLRHYDGVRAGLWGGDKNCEHVWSKEVWRTGPKKWNTGTGKTYNKQTTSLKVSQGKLCKQCGAWFGELGLEPTPELYIAHIVEVFRELKRILRPDGAVWLNLGDQYENGNLLMMPHRTAQALQQDGWIVRNDLVWKKTNPMPQAVKGWWYKNDNLKRGSWRHTRAHEFVFHLVKQPGYFCDQSIMDDGINPRSVIETSEARREGVHFALFHPEMIRFLMQVSCPQKCCSRCGAPRVKRNGKYRPTCKHRARAVPGIVLDPFAGDGTTNMVARELGLRCIGLDLSYEYLLKAKRHECS